MKRLKKAAKVWLILCFTLLITNCNNDESAKPLTQEAKISEAKIWFKDYESSSENYELLQNLNYDWAGAETKKAKDGTEITIVPVIERKKDQSKIWEQRLYIYKVGENDYTALLYEIYPDDKKNPAEQFSFDSGNFNGYITAWDLKNGFVKAAKFENDKIIENGFVELISKERLDLVSRTKLEPDIETTGGGIALREVVIENNYRDTYIVYIPRDSVNNSVGSSESYTYNHGGGGGGSGAAITPVLPQKETNPCDQIKNVLNFNDANGTNVLKPDIIWLKNLVKAPVNDKERGVEVRKKMNPDETFRYETTRVFSDQEFSVALSTNYDNVGGIHSHPADGYAMFSFQDVRFLLDLYEAASSTRKEEVFNGLVCKDNAGNTNTYMLKIDDIEALRNQVNAMWNNPKYARFQDEELRIKAIHKDQALKYKDSNGQLEKSFLQQFAAFGISIYKADDALNSISKLSFNYSTVTPIPCN